MPTQKVLQRPRKVQLRGVVEALLYILRTACPWRLLPRYFPKRSSVQHYFYASQKHVCASSSISFSCKLPANAKSRSQPFSRFIDSQSSRPPKAPSARYDALKKVNAASAISSLTPVRISFAPSCTPPTSTISTPPAYSRRSAISSPRCVTSLPTALTPSPSCKPLLPRSRSRLLRSSSDRTRPQVLRYCHRAAWSSEPSPGLLATRRSRRISKLPLPAAKRRFISLQLTNDVAISH